MVPAATLPTSKQLIIIKQSSAHWLIVAEEENLQDSFNAIWEAHMQQLIPCGLCARTFFPDRIEVGNIIIINIIIVIINIVIVIINIVIVIRYINDPARG